MYPEAQKYLKRAQWLTAITFAFVIVSYTMPQTALMAFILTLVNLLFISPLMDKGHYLTKGNFHNAKGGTWPVLVTVLSVILSLKVTDQPVTNATFSVVLVLIIFILLTILQIIAFEKKFKPLWENYFQ